MNRNLLRAKIVENGLTMDEVADKSGMHRGTLYAKLAGRSQFYVDEINRICDLLHIDQPEDKCKIFLD